MAQEITYALVKIVKGISSDAHIFFDRDDEGFYIGITDSGSDSVKNYVGQGNNVTIYKTYKGAIREAEKRVS